MSKGIIYLMSTAVEGLIKIGRTDNFTSRMKYLESNGYRNITGLKREFAIAVDDCAEKESLLHSIFSKSRISDTELFSVDIDLAKQLLSAFDGEIVYPKIDRKEIFEKATDAVEEKELKLNRHHFKEINFKSTLTGKEYHGGTGEDGTLAITEIATGIEVPNNSKPSKRDILGQAIKDLGGQTTKTESLYQRYRKLSKLVLNNSKYWCLLLFY